LKGPVRRLPGSCPSGSRGASPTTPGPPCSETSTSERAGDGPVAAVESPNSAAAAVAAAAARGGSRGADAAPGTAEAKARSRRRRRPRRRRVRLRPAALLSGNQRGAGPAIKATGPALPVLPLPRTVSPTFPSLRRRTAAAAAARRPTSSARTAVPAVEEPQRTRRSLSRFGARGTKASL
jgi:hypothetical protein